jgi:uncharacterized protein (DUF1810 family)
LKEENNVGRGNYMNFGAALLSANTHSPSNVRFNIVKLESAINYLFERGKSLKLLLKI